MAVTWGDFQARRGATPAYVQLANWVAERIESGDLQPGDQIPAQRGLAELTGHSPETVSKAMALLRDRGLVETSNLGTFVAEPRDN
jgi:DNA-binding GntR family transcriptional regulator